VQNNHTKTVTMVLSEEAVKALELMPVGLLDHEQEESPEVKKLETIKYTTMTLQKMGYASYYITGAGGMEEIIPHAVFTEQAINEWVNVSHFERSLAFKRSCTGIALMHANAALQACQTGLNNEDNNAAAPAV
jgi:hypothetical protein